MVNVTIVLLSQLVQKRPDAQLEAQVARTDLMVSVHRDPRSSEGSSVWAEYSTDLFDPRTIERLLGHYENLLAAEKAFMSA